MGSDVNITKELDNSLNVLDLIIIGAGPTGIACGIAASKAGLNYTILEKGLLVNSIYNFPTNMTFFSTSTRLEIGDIPFISHNEKPTRAEALEYYRRIVSSFKLKVRYKIKVNQILKGDKRFELSCSKGLNFRARNVIIATGYYDNPQWLGIDGEELSKVKHYYDDAHPYIGQNVLVIGAANSACDVALETWQKGANVTMVVRDSELYQKVKYWILPNIENRIKEGSIKAYFNSSVSSIHEDYVLLDTPEGQIQVLNDYVLAMTGYKPDYSLLKSAGVEISDEFPHKPNLDATNLQSNVQGLYVAGVVVSGMNTSELFIENTRNHGQLIINDILSKR